MVEKKKSVKKVLKKDHPQEPQKQYIFTVGRRKTSTARVKLFLDGTGAYKINTRDFSDYFPTLSLQKILFAPLIVTGTEKQFDGIITATGGGVASQADAIRLGLARALVKLDPLHKTVLKKAGLMTRDSREKERKKPGLKRARRAPQWQKR